MIESLFKSPVVLARHQNAPLLEERERYFRHRANQGCVNESLLSTARELAQIVQLADIPHTPVATDQQVRKVADRCAKLKWSTMRKPKKNGSKIP